MSAGIIGVPLGTFLSSKLRYRYPNSDALVCANGLLISAPLIYFSLVLARHSGGWCFTLVFFAEVSLNLGWGIVADILLVRMQKKTFFFAHKKTWSELKWIQNGYSAR